MGDAKPQLSKDECCTRVSVILATARGEKINICYGLFGVIEQAPKDQQHLVLRHAAEHFDDDESSEELDMGAPISEDEKNALKDRYGSLVDEMFGVVLKENLSEDDFYRSLWDTLHNPLLRDKKAQVFALYFTFIDRRMPYFHLDEGLKMSNEEFREAFQRTQQRWAKIRFILTTKSFSQKSEQADLVLKELDGAPDYKQRLVLIARLIAELKRYEERLRARLQGAGA
ncbi:MAG: hypothetical protein ABSH46_03890 [Bryobacteraceae bacterium]|jgi:hypothetical protein